MFRTCVALTFKRKKDVGLNFIPPLGALETASADTQIVSERMFHIVPIILWMLNLQN